MRVADTINIAELRELARRRLPRVAFDYLDGGAEDEITLGQNRAAFRRYGFVPRILSGSAPRDLGVTLFGRAQTVPWVVGPTGMNGIFWRGADLALARAAHRAGAVYAHPTAANVALEALARAVDGVSWFQLYPWGDRQVWARLIERAQGAGYRALIVTVDSLVSGNRERDRRNHFAHKVRYTPRIVLDGLLHPRWLAGVWLRGGPPRFENMAEFARPGASAADLADYIRSMRNPDFSWDDLRFIRDRWRGPFVVKGVLSPQDALRAANMGADGIVVSNHGGRQLDGAIATLDALPPVVAAVGDMMTVLIDGGFRRGSDIVKALALGAKAVVLGRAPLYGIAAAGEPGAARALEILRDEMLRVLTLLGCPSVEALSPASLAEAAPLQSPVSSMWRQAC
jgi:(S)-mandelate dehydrogenase